MGRRICFRIWARGEDAGTTTGEAQVRKLQADRPGAAGSRFTLMNIRRMCSIVQDHMTIQLNALTLPGVPRMVERDSLGVRRIKAGHVWMINC